jgi:hypothetical protein
VTQTGENTSTVSQAGLRGIGNVEQAGTGNTASIAQDWATVFSESYIAQDGTGHSALTTQVDAHHSESFITQTGAGGHSATVSQTYDNNKSYITQTGSMSFQFLNTATVVQESGWFGSGNVSTISQYLGLQAGTVTQFGNGNSSTITQGGWANRSVVYQEGHDNAATALQWDAMVSESYINQTGDGNLADVRQDGEIQHSHISQGGDGNEATVNQNYAFPAYATNHYSSIIQDADDGLATVLQLGVNHTSWIEQLSGTGHMAIVSQTGNGHTSTITQYGTGNTAVVVQSN